MKKSIAILIGAVILLFGYIVYDGATDVKQAKLIHEKMTEIQSLEHKITRLEIAYGEQTIEAGKLLNEMVSLNTEKRICLNLLRECYFLHGRLIGLLCGDCPGPAWTELGNIKKTRNSIGVLIGVPKKGEKHED